MLGSGVAFAVYLLSHALAVRPQVVTAERHAVGTLSAWLATWLLVPGFGLLPFVLATWPDGRIYTRWLRPFGKAAATGLALVTVAQAFARSPSPAPGSPSSSRRTGRGARSGPNRPGRCWSRSGRTSGAGCAVSCMTGSGRC